MQPSQPPILECAHLRKHYADRPVLQGISLRLEKGERLALTGPSGCGKTTLLNCLGGIDRPDSGTILFQGQNIATLPDETLADLRRQHLGSIFQFFHLLPTLSVLENVAFPLHLLGFPGPIRTQRASELLSRVHLSHRVNASPATLSGGEMQRVAIARALVHRPSLLLADEPTGNLDSANGTNILHLLRELSEETGTALLMVTHSSEATQICHRTLHLRDGALTSST